MKISLLQRREPFEKILITTLNNFFNSENKGTFIVNWNTDKRGDWLVNSHLNAIFFVLANEIVFSQIKNEFSRSLVRWKQPFQRLYVFLATNHQTAKYFATAGLSINPPLFGAANIIIIGGNHHIRLLDYNKNCVYVINKDGFDKQFLNNEIILRQNYSFLPIPKLFEISTDRTWYSEELIKGTPLNRLLDLSKKTSAFTQIKQALDKLYQKTKRNILIETYLEQIIFSITEHATAISLLSNDHRQIISEAILMISKMIKFLSLQTPKLITLAETHGDFQPANVLVDIDKVWLIDWEYTGLRQIDFDHFVFDLASRAPKNLHKRFVSQYLQVNNQTPKKLKLLVFLVEELELRLRETNNFQFTSLNPGLVFYLKELKKIIHFLGTFFV